MTAPDITPADEALWALTLMEAHERHDAEGVAALLTDLTTEVASARLAGMAAGVVIQLCLVTGESPGEWIARMRATLTGMDGAA